MLMTSSLHSSLVASASCQFLLTLEVPVPAKEWQEEEGCCWGSTFPKGEMKFHARESFTISGLATEGKDPV